MTKKTLKRNRFYNLKTFICHCSNLISALQTEPLNFNKISSNYNLMDFKI